MKKLSLAPYLQRFFTDRLGTQMQASPNTIASYRDTFRLLLKHAAAKLAKTPTDLKVADIDADLVGAFLADIERTRGNGARSRNARLSAIRSFFRYVAVNEPQLLHHCQRILAMPSKRHEKRTIDYLTRPEIEAVIAAPDLTTWHGRRDRALLVLALQTGLRVSELINLLGRDVVLGPGAHVRCLGKGRKERATPIRKDSIKLLRGWVTERGGNADEPLFVSNRNARLSRDAVEQIVRKHVRAAVKVCPSLKKKRVTPHVLRHSAAMQLLQNGVDRTVIALWLESVETTQMYIHADMEIKEKAMARTRPVTAKGGRYRPDDKLLAFLEAL
jgi:integrase/recombinase XerD